MDSMDPLENFKKSVNEIVESKKEPKTSLLLEVSLESDGLDFVPFNNSSVIVLMDSMNPYEDFMKSMEERLEENQQIKDCVRCFDELLIWYLKSNGENNHRYIIEAFFDLLNSYISSTNTKSCSHSFTNSPFFGCTPSVFASPPFLSLLEAEDETVDKITTTRSLSLIS
ncbi:hypothetical protein P3S67_021758 [Capsicum chacoense]